MGALDSFGVIFLDKALGASGLKQKTRPCLGERGGEGKALFFQSPLCPLPGYTHTQQDPLSHDPAAGKGCLEP